MGWPPPHRDVPDDVGARITARTDTDALTAWIARAATAHRIGDVLGAGAPAVRPVGAASGPFGY